MLNQTNLRRNAKISLCRGRRGNRIDGWSATCNSSRKGGERQREEECDEECVGHYIRFVNFSKSTADIVVELIEILAILSVLHSNSIRRMGEKRCVNTMDVAQHFLSILEKLKRRRKVNCVRAHCTTSLFALASHNNTIYPFHLNSLEYSSG